MKCTDVGERLLDMAAGMPAEASMEAHVHGCAACAERLASLRQTLALLDEWPAPEPSPYFDSRLAVRLREETARPRAWVLWLRKPLLAGAMAALLLIAGLLIGPHRAALQPATMIATTQLQPGTAVSDLQDLDKNHDILSNFDMLDDLSDDEPQSANR